MIDRYFKKQLKELAPELLEMLKERGVNVAKYEKILQDQREEKNKQKENREITPRRQKSEIKKRIKENREKDFAKAIKRIETKERADDLLVEIEKTANVAVFIQKERQERERNRLETLNELSQLAQTLNPTILEQVEQRQKQARERQKIIEKVKRGEYSKQVIDYWRKKMISSIQAITPQMLFNILVEFAREELFQIKKQKRSESK